MGGCRNLKWGGGGESQQYLKGGCSVLPFPPDTMAAFAGVRLSPHSSWHPLPSSAGISLPYQCRHLPSPPISLSLGIANWHCHSQALPGSLHSCFLQLELSGQWRKHDGRWESRDSAPHAAVPCIPLLEWGRSNPGSSPSPRSAADSSGSMWVCPSLPAPYLFPWCCTPAWGSSYALDVQRNQASKTMGK